MRKTARAMISGFAAQLTKLIKEYPDPRHIMRANELGYEHQAVDYIVEMARTYHKREALEEGKTLTEEKL